MPIDKTIRKVMVIGSGPIVIGQAAEFDYAGAQACRVLKQEGMEVVLVNSNPATIMTDKALADEIYLEPLTLTSVKRIIEAEKPDSLLAGLGGQTGLTLAMQLDKDGFLASHGVRLIGTNAEAIDKAEDRKLFKETMEAIGEPCIPSDIANSLEEALEIAARIGYPVIIRPAFTLGGTGGGVAYTAEELNIVAQTGLDASPITQVLVERYIYGWKEIEFETMRDRTGNAVTVCSMENFDPVGVHTGDSIVVAPAMSLNDEEYAMLRNAALNIVKELNIVGGCNCQFALEPGSKNYAVIEVNPRVSRSSALASKATGYPIAKVTTRLALGYTLDEIKNGIDGGSCAAYEPDVQYTVVKFPRWPFDKFPGASRKLGTQMKATGEVMSIGSSFEMGLMKAIRGAAIGLDTLNAPPVREAPVLERLADCDDRRVFTVFEALKEGISKEEIYRITKIDGWFLDRLENLLNYEKALKNGLTEALYRQGKRYGYTDAAIMRLSGADSVPEFRSVYRTVYPSATGLDSCTPYFYADAEGECEARSYRRSGKPTILVLGSGPIRIGQGIEFDYSSVHCVWTLQKLGYDVVIINNNPETVSTDYDTADRLYFEPLTPEDVMQIIEVEKPVGVVVAFGGQTAISLAAYLDARGIPILGTSAEGIDLAEDRERFDALLAKLGILRPKGRAVTGMEEALRAAEEIGYPVLLRPSYVIGGQNMQIVHEPAETERYMSRILAQGIDNPVLIDKYMEGTELEVDVISDGSDILIPGIMEHIERAGVHSGDSIAVYPPYNLNDRMTEEIVDCSRKLALSLGTRGLVNIQYLIFGGKLYVIEVNPRASRTIPYISKVSGIPMVDIAAKVMLGSSLKDCGIETETVKAPPYYAVKVPVFSFEKLSDVNSYLGPEMKSTGEVLGIGRSVEEALYKGLRSAGMVVDSTVGKERGVLLSVDTHGIPEVVRLAKKLDDLNFHIYATEETAAEIATLGIDAECVRGIKESDHIFELLESGWIQYIVYTGALHDATMDDYTALHRRAVQLSIPCFTSLDTANALADIIASRYAETNTELVDIARLRTEKRKIAFSKLEAAGDDYIFIEDWDSEICCPESLSVGLCDRNRGIGGYGIVLIGRSEKADARMRLYNRDGSSGGIGGNAIRCVAKYLYDKGICRRKDMSIETDSGVMQLHVYPRNGEASLVTVELGKVEFAPEKIPVRLGGKRVVNYPARIGGKPWRISCLSLGNPHCVVFTDRIDRIDMAETGPQFEYSELFPERVNTEFVRVVNRSTLSMRVFERGNGETNACGTGACAAVIAAVENGHCAAGETVTVKTRGGDLLVCWDGSSVTLSGETRLVFEGSFMY